MHKAVWSLRISRNYLMKFPCPSYACVGRKNLSSEKKFYSSLSTNDAFGFVAAFLIPVIIIGNSFVIITLFRFPKFRTTTNFLIGSLAMADVILG